MTPTHTPVDLTDEQRANLAKLAAPTTETGPQRDLVEDLTGALRFIMAFYEPGQRYLDTEAWKCAEAGGRAALARGEAVLAARAKALAALNAETNEMVALPNGRLG